VCGAWWSGDVCWDGAPNGYGVYDVRGEEVRWRYKGTGLAVVAQSLGVSFREARRDDGVLVVGSSPGEWTLLADPGTASAVADRWQPAAGDGHVSVIDVTHGVPRHDVRAGALILRRALPSMPPGVHLAVVDPAVGTARRALALRTAEEDRLLVGPDNGLLSLAAQRFGGAVEAVDISRSIHRLEPVSATFHGRDVFAPDGDALVAHALAVDGYGFDQAYFHTDRVVGGQRRPAPYPSCRRPARSPAGARASASARWGCR